MQSPPLKRRWQSDLFERTTLSAFSLGWNLIWNNLRIVLVYCAIVRRRLQRCTGLYLLSRHFLRLQLGHARRDRAPSKRLADSFEASLRRPAAWLLKATALAASVEGFPEARE